MPTASRESRAAVVAERRPAAKRGRLNERQGVDVDRAARTVRETGVSLKVHGVEVFFNPKNNSSTPCSLGQQQPQQRQRRRTEVEKSLSPLLPQQSARKARAARRLLEFNANKRKELLLASSRVRTFLRQFRRERVQLVWTAWMRGETPEPAVEPMEA